MIGLVARISRYSAIAIAGHGLLFALLAFGIGPLISGSVPEWFTSLVFFFVFVPASILAKPFWPMLWKLGLIQAPGWFSWPKPLGYLLVYVIWCGGLLAISLLLNRYRRLYSHADLHP